MSHREPPPLELPAKAIDATAEVQLCVMVAPSVRAKVRTAAKARGLTVRALVLSALRDAGVLDNLDDTEFADRRATIAAAKARLWRERGRVQVEIADTPDASPPVGRKLESGVT